jgi:hypothetical protein
MGPLFTVRSGEEVSALSFSVAVPDSAMRSAARLRPAVVARVDRVVDARCAPCESDRLDFVAPGALDGICSASHGASIRSTPSTAAGWQATLRLKRLSASGADDESHAHRRHPVVEPSRSLTMYATTQAAACRPGAESFDRAKALPRKGLPRILAKLLARRRTPSIEEQYLAQAVDAQDLQVRLFALERAQP